MAATPPLFLFLFLAMAILSSPTSSRAHNITAILSPFPDYSLFNSYLSQTRLADEINSRVTITCLVLPNAAVSSLASSHSLASIKNALRLLVLLDYFDPPKLHSLPSPSSIPTLLQASSVPNAFLNITANRTAISFGPTSHFTKSIHADPYNISVLEISSPVIIPGLFDAASVANANITHLLENAGCAKFAEMIVSSGVIKMFEAAMDKGLTVLAPRDEAVKVLRNVSSAEMVTLLEYHALPAYAPSRRRRWRRRSSRWARWHAGFTGGL